MTGDITQLSIKKLLDGSANYVIPMYQRNYAWDEGEITQLIQDVIDYLPSGRNYYIGTLVVYQRPDAMTTTFETIDGQQRLTTLSLLTSYLKKISEVDASWYATQSILFDSREHSRTTFDAIFKGNLTQDPAYYLADKQINSAILNGYRLIQKILPQKLKESAVSVNKFAIFLFDRVQIMRVKVPVDTDLNHYFEIMNSRGEQLEKHEVLKAKLMEKIESIADPEERAQSQDCLHVVWEACGNMERYVQMGFTPSQRDIVFGEKDWGRFDMADFDSLRLALRDARKNSAVVAPDECTARKLDEIIAGTSGSPPLADKADEAPERFNTVINFGNFLLHVLRVETGQDIPLDDKRLLATFETHVLGRQDAVAAVKRFTFSLLRCKYLYDQYVIKREFTRGVDRWSLQRLKWSEGGDKRKSGRAHYVSTFGAEDGPEVDNRRILMLLSAFHVSTPTLVYKHWLNAALHYVFSVDQVDANAYLLHMESVARAFVFDRYLAPANGKEYFSMIYQNNGLNQTLRGDFALDKLDSQLTFGNIQNNLVFNYLDYLLWLELDAGDPAKIYEFTFRSSVEHYYPQRPRGFPQLDHESLNSFGNLCLISHSKNSRLSDFMPVAKKEFYKNNTIDSVKQYLMMCYPSWDAAAIRDHGENMKEVLLRSLERRDVSRLEAHVDTAELPSAGG